jgi:hypothetical protein
MTSASPPKPKLTDCPWLWLMIFSSTAMSAATLIGPKYATRMARKERMMSANEVIAVAREAGVRAAEVERTSPPVVPYSEEDYRERPRFNWMYAIFTTTMLVGAVGTHRWRLKYQRAAPS